MKSNTCALVAAGTGQRTYLLLSEKHARRVCLRRSRRCCIPMWVAMMRLCRR